MPPVIKNIWHVLLVFILYFLQNAMNQSEVNQVCKFTVKENTVGLVATLSTNIPNTTLELDAKGQDFLEIQQSIDKTTANLTLLSPLDREVYEHYDFSIFIQNNDDTLRLFKNVSIKVGDMNDNAPVFVKSNSIFIVQCYNIGSVITKVQATDQDSGLNGQIRYDIRQSKQMFAINNKTGVITVNRAFASSLQYEEVLNITATDSGLPSLVNTTVIRIKLLPNKQFTVRQWSTKETTITTIPCSDRSLIKRLSIINETENGVITAQQRRESNITIKVHRLVIEQAGTSFCLVVKIICGTRNKESLLAINTTVVEESREVVKLITVSLNYTGYFNLSYLEKLEVKFDGCVTSSYKRSRGGSRAFLLPTNNNTIVIKRRYFSDSESTMMNNTNIARCISSISVGNTSHQINVTSPTDVSTTRQPVTTSSNRSVTKPPLTSLLTGSLNTETITGISPISDTRTSPTQGKSTLNTKVHLKEEKETNTYEIIAWALGVLFLIIIIGVVIHSCRRKIAQRRAENVSMEMSQINSTKAPWREIDKGCIATGKELGSGFFGVVLQGTVILDGQSKQCAVKMLKGHATEVDNKELINELQIISRIGYHPNIINLIGACTTNGPALIVLEFAPNGNLLEYLRANRDEVYTNMTTLRPDIKLDLRTRLKIAYEVAQGMRHLSSRKCVHRDLAARNVLLDEHFVAKVTDFGLSRDVYEEGVYQINSQSKMPLKWMAIESLETMVFTTHSDVWSFGVLVWEIETGGATPYPGLMGREIFQELTSGHRLEQPPTCPDTLYELVSKCWIRDPCERPSFQQLCNELGSFLQEEAGYEDLFITVEPNECSETTNL